MENIAFSYHKIMKTPALFLLLIISIESTGQISKHPIIYNNIGLRGGWGDNDPGYVIKMFDLSYRYSFNSTYKNNGELLFYPITFLRMREFPIDIGIGGGISFSDQSSYGYGKFYFGKDILSTDRSYHSDAFYRLGLGAYSDFMFGNRSQRIGLYLIHTFPVSYSIKARLLTGTSYHTLEKSWKFNLGVTIALEDYNEPIRAKKPVIYAYTEDTVKTQLTFDFNGALTFVYPKYDDKWDVTLFPSGTIQDNKTYKNYPYLFWEGDFNLSMISSSDQGFIVRKDEMISFLEENLSFIGLNEKESTDFITFWAPQLTDDRYIVKFLQQEQCDQIATYQCSVNPDTFLRLYVTFEPILGSPDIHEQDLLSVKRKGFTLVEWGGMILPTLTASK